MIINGTISFSKDDNIEKVHLSKVNNRCYIHMEQMMIAMNVDQLIIFTAMLQGEINKMKEEQIDISVGDALKMGDSIGGKG